MSDTSAVSSERFGSDASLPLLRGGANQGSSPKSNTKKKQPASPPAILRRIRLPKPLSEPELRQANLIADAAGIHAIAARFLVSRNYHQSIDLTNFLSNSEASLEAGQHLPKNLHAAAGALIDAVVLKKKIAIVCDYDADGGSSAAQMVLFLRALGASYKLIPTDRFNGGYGLQESHVRAAKRAKCDTLVALDIGTTNHAALELCSRTGMYSIVIDHHRVDPLKGLPPAGILVNPQQDGCGFEEGRLCTAGLVNLLAREVQRQVIAGRDTALKQRALKIDFGLLNQLAAFGTVADQVPLHGLNRRIVKCGLKAMNGAGGLWIDALKTIAAVEGPVTPEQIAFRLAPLVNAVGRIASQEKVPGVMLAIKQMTAGSAHWAESFAKKLYQYNSQRKRLERKAEAFCRKQLHGLVEKNGKLPPIIIVGGKGVHPGVAGLVASRFLERWHRPVIVFSGPNSEGVCTGSGRSPKGINLFSILKQPEVHRELRGAGGHARALGCGFDFNNLDNLRKAASNAVRKECRGKIGVPMVSCDLEVRIEDILSGGEKLVRDLERTGPWGDGNEAPKLCLTNVRVRTDMIVGRRHLEVSIRHDDGGPAMLARLYFRKFHPALRQGKLVNITGKPAVNIPSEHNPELNTIVWEIGEVEEVKAGTGTKKSAKPAA